MPPIMANSKNGLGHKDKYLNTKYLVKRNANVQYDSSNIYYLEVMTHVNFKKVGQMSRSKGLVPTKKVF